MLKFRYAIVLFFFFASVAHAQNGSITVEVTDIKNSEGLAAIGLYSSKNEFPKRGKSLIGADVKISGATAIHTFKNIPIGDDYAIAVFHDSNSNGKLDKNFLGIPKEGYAFSNNASGTFGPPKFKDASFRFVEDTHIKIKMGY